MKRMKKALFVMAALAFFAASPVLAGSTGSVVIADGSTAVAAGHSYSPVVVNTEGLEGYFALQGSITGSGTAKIEYLVSADGISFSEPQSAHDIIYGFTAASGPAGDGRFYVQFAPDFCRYLKIVISETGGSASVTPVVRLLKR